MKYPYLRILFVELNRAAQRDKGGWGRLPNRLSVVHSKRYVIHGSF